MILVEKMWNKAMILIHEDQRYQRELFEGENASDRHDHDTMRERGEQRRKESKNLRCQKRYPIKIAK
jgi:hypothetical protein